MRMRRSSLPLRSGSLGHLPPGLCSASISWHRNGTVTSGHVTDAPAYSPTTQSQVDQASPAATGTESTGQINLEEGTRC